jgi:GT2 family glycosyltransferase
MFSLLVREGPTALPGWTRARIEEYRRRRLEARLGANRGYGEWIAAFDTLDASDRSAIARAVANLEQPAHFSIVISHDESAPARWAEKAIASVHGQLYPHREVLLEKDVESALARARGELVVFLDGTCELSPDALAVLALERAARPDLVLIYSDEDLLSEEGGRSEPDFKPDWNPDLLLATNYLGHLVAFDREAVRRVGGKQGSDYDLALRCSAGVASARIRHVPFVLAHAPRRVSAERVSAETRETLARHLGLPVEPGRIPDSHHVRYPVPEPAPLVSIIIPTRDGERLLRRCVESLRAKTTYPRYELVIVDNQSRDPGALAYLAELERSARVLRHDQPFNFAAVNNRAVAQTEGELLCLLNNDTEVISPGWLDELVAQALRPGIGAVGARLLYTNGTVQHAGVVLGLGGVAGHAHRGLPGESAGPGGRALLVQNVSAVTAACLVVRRSVYGEVGGMDERLAVALNDVDFCLKVRARGYRNLYTPFAELYHHESASRGHDLTPEQKARAEREKALVLERWGPELERDPAYNPNLTLLDESWGLAWPPRVERPWW